jgi:hypothetical protein
MLDSIELNYRYSEHLRKVEQEQLYKQLNGGQAGPDKQMIRRLGDFLIAIGQYLKGVHSK